MSDSNIQVMPTEALDRLTLAVRGFVERLNYSGIIDVEQNPISEDVTFSFKDGSEKTMNFTRGVDGTSVLDVQLYNDPVYPNDVFLSITMSDGRVLRTQDSLSGYHGASVTSAYVQNNFLYFTLDTGETLDPVPVNGLEAVSITDVRIENGDLIATLSNGTKVNAGAAENLKGRGIEDIIFEEDRMMIRYSDSDVYVHVTDVNGITGIQYIDGVLNITMKSDTEGPSYKFPIRGYTGLFVEDGSLKARTNQLNEDGSPLIENIGPVDGLEPEMLESITISDNQMFFKTTRGTDIPPVPVFGLQPVNVTGFQYDPNEGTLFAILSNGQLVDTGLNRDIRGRGITNVLLLQNNSIQVTYTDNSTEIIGVLPGIVNVDMFKGEVRVYYSTAPLTPVTVGFAPGIQNMTQRSDGRIEVTYTNDTKALVGTIRSVRSIEYVNGRLVFTYNTGETETTSPINIKGDDGVGIDSTDVNSSGDLIVIYTDGRSHNAGNVRQVWANNIADSKRYVATEQMLTEGFPIEHTNFALVFVERSDENVPIADSLLNYETSGFIIVEEGHINVGEKVVIVAFNEKQVDSNTRGVASVETVSGYTFNIVLLDGTVYPISVTPPEVNLEDLPPGIEQIYVNPENDLMVRLTGQDQPTSVGKVNNAIHVTGANISENGDLIIGMSDDSSINAGNVWKNLSFEDVKIVGGNLILTDALGNEFNAGPVAVWMTDAEIDLDNGRLMVTMSDGTVIDAGPAINPTQGQPYDFICYQGQYQFEVPWTGFEVLFYANGVLLSESSYTKVPYNPETGLAARINLTTVRNENDIVRIILITRAGTVAAKLLGQDNVEGDAIVMIKGKEIVFESPSLVKIGEPYYFTAEPGQVRFGPIPNVGLLEVYLEGIRLFENKFSFDTEGYVLIPSAVAGDEIVITTLRKPISSNVLYGQNKAIVTFDTYSHGGTIVGKTWTIRNINTIRRNDIGVSIFNNRVVLDAGYYSAKIWAMTARTRAGALRLINQTNSNEVLEIGPSAYASPDVVGDSYGENVKLELETDFHLATQSQLYLQQISLRTQGTYGLGIVGSGRYNYNLGIRQSDLKPNVNAQSIPATLVWMEFTKVF